MKRFGAILATLAIAMCVGLILWDRHPALKPAFIIDPTQPFHIEFGRGSGWHGLDTFKLDLTGKAVLHRMKVEHKGGVNVLSWETTTLQLSPDALSEVLKAVESNNLLSMSGSYTANVADGTQWVLWIRQGEHEKSAYFDNNFPQPITAFAAKLDDILARSGFNQLIWQAVPDTEGRQHEKALWDSIRH